MEKKIIYGIDNKKKAFTIFHDVDMIIQCVIIIEIGNYTFWIFKKKFNETMHMHEVYTFRKCFF